MKKIKKSKKIIVFGVVMMVLATAVTATVFGVYQYQRNRQYEELQTCFAQGKYAEAEKIIYELGEYKNAKKLLPQCQDMIEAATLMEQKEYAGAREIYQKYEMEEEINECTYQIAMSYADSREYEKALQEFSAIASYEDATNQARNVEYNYAMELYEKQQYTDARMYFIDAGDYKDAADFAEKCRIGIKFEKFDMGAIQYNADDPMEMYSYIEDQIVEIFYYTWYDINGKKLVINEDTINGIPYQVTSIDTNGAYPLFEFTFENDSTRHTICRLSPIVDEYVINFMECISFDSSIYYEYSGKKQKEIIQAAFEWEEQLRQEEEAEKQQRVLQEESIKIACHNDVLNYYNIEGKDPVNQLFTAFNAWQAYNEKISISGSTYIFECDVCQTWNFGLYAQHVKAEYLIDGKGNIQRQSIIHKPI